MKVYLGQASRTQSWQKPFPEETDCCRCGGQSRLGFVAIEEAGEDHYLCNLYENNPPPKLDQALKVKGDFGYWFHDAVAVAVYFCRDCLEPTALYNQA